jgi:hypothetical protein
MTEREANRRRRIALEAARLISEHGIRDYHAAKRKAVERLGLRDESALPKNDEIDAALREHQRLFRGKDQPHTLRTLREAACEAMDYLRQFTPRLVGSVLDGTADENSAVCLHLYCENPEIVINKLTDDHITFTEDSRRLRLDLTRTAEYPVLRLRQENVNFDLTLLPTDAIRQAPLDRGGDRPLHRASLAQVQALCDADQRAAIGE